MTALAKDPARFVETSIEQETVIMVLDSGDFFSLEGTGRAVWEAIDGSRDREALVAALASDYGRAPDDIGAEVDAFLADLRAAGLVRED